MRPKEALVAVGLSWVLASAIQALYPSGFPELFHPSLTLSFESVSGFTTTAGNRLGKHRGQLQGDTFLEELLTHWLGGMGIIVLGLAVLPFSGRWRTSAVSPPKYLVP